MNLIIYYERNNNCVNYYFTIFIHKTVELKQIIARFVCPYFVK